MNEPKYKDLFTRVETWKDWSQSHPELSTNTKDTGVDLVGTLSDDSGYAAIQCKFYQRDASVPMSGISTFIATANTKHFPLRFIVATNDRWTDNALSVLKNQDPPVTLIKRSDLAESLVDWSQYLPGNEKVAMRERRTPRPYQREAIKAVKKGFETAERGKLIMACGTGKTYTSMKIAEEVAGPGKLVMFLVPSLSLLSQTLSDWKQQCRFPIHAFAVCSDASTGKADLEDTAELTSASELSYPATTDAKKLAKKVRKALKQSDGMTVIFSTYHSMEVVSAAQKIEKNSLPNIDLVICDEAHRTAGGFFRDETEKPFTRIHKSDFIKASKRLYMTATPKVYGSKAKEQQSSNEVVLYSMDDEATYGKTFHEITFTQAVQQYQCLVDYKVIVLTVSEDIAKETYSYADIELGGINVSHAAKVIGCWRALSKLDLQNEVSMGDDLHAMRRAVGFAQVIDPSEKFDRVSSKAFAKHFDNVIRDFRAKEREKFIKAHPDDINALSRFDADYALRCETKHIDGSMNAVEKDALLNWLRKEPGEHLCKILFNVRCLSEGVDVPALDAVLFLSPRKSMVDVVQTVGRVMRKAPGKERGYVIIPIVTPSGLAPDLILDKNKDFETVWQVLRALKSIDSNFGSIVDGQLGKINNSKMEVICLTNSEIRRRGKTTTPPRKPRKGKGGKDTEDGVSMVQGSFDFGRNEILEDAIKSRIVKRVGNRREWGDWAEDVGDICKEQIQHIERILSDDGPSKQAFEGFAKEIRETLNGELTDSDIIEMLGQHVVTKPVLDAFFKEYPFSEKNPIAKAMTEMVAKLDKEGLRKANEYLKGFYEAVKFRMTTVQTQAERQAVIKELFEKFFKYAFPKQQEKLGIVYTPVEIVDFINQSVADILQKEFHTSIADEGVHILDPFTGTGTFMARLMQSGLIPKEKLPQKFENDMHASEIMPLAYYVASMNLESVYYDICPIGNAKDYKPNNVLILTDTFADHQRNDLFETSLAENNARLKKVIDTDIRVIIGNPPYSVGQGSANDNNQNKHYGKLDKRLAETYVSRTDSTNKGKLYDSYIRAYRWASDRIGDKGVIGFITNAGWLASNSADGMRKCMAEEFSEIWIWHLKGNQRTVGEQSHKEGGKVFGQGSRAPVSVVILVKNPEHKGECQIHFATVEDYLTREEKLEQTRKARSVLNLKTETIKPDAHGDWLNQRDDSFSKFIKITGTEKEGGVFSDQFIGVATNRDAWTYGSDQKSVLTNIIRMMNAYNSSLVFHLKHSDIDSAKKVSEGNISWSRGLAQKLSKNIKLGIPLESNIVRSNYRPFFIQYLYYEKNGVIETPGRWDVTYPTHSLSNLLICVSGVSSKAFSCLMTNCITDLHFNGDSQCFPRYIYEKVLEKKTMSRNTTGNLFDEPQDSNSGCEVVDGYRRLDAITPNAMKHFREAYPEKTITIDDLFYYIYGILHSEDYRQKYANNLMKELPRIPRVATFEDFKAFSVAGRKLADLHVNFESVPEYSGVKIMEDKRDGFSYRVEQIKYGKIPGKKGNAGKDKTKLIYNDFITVENIPLEAQEYVVNKKSALDWIVERVCVKIDKDSGIVNDFNDYATEMHDSRYPLSLFLRVITVSLETMKIVKSLPKLTIHLLDRETPDDFS